MNQYDYQISELAEQDDLLLLRLKPLGGGSVFPFKPGQYATLSFKEGQGQSFERSFSISSSPLNTDFLEFGIRKIGTFTNNLAKLPVGSSIKVRGPFGHFVFDPPSMPAAVLVAGGIGITPFMSMIRYLYQQRLNNKLTLLFSNRHLAHTPYLSELLKISQASPNFSLNLIVTDDQTAKAPAGANLMQGRLSPQMLQQVVRPLDNSKLYLICGPSPFMDAAREHLISLGIAETNILQEEFSFGPPKIRKSDLLFYIGAFGAASIITIAALFGIYRVERNRTLASQAIPATSVTTSPVTPTTNTISPATSITTTPTTTSSTPTPSTAATPTTTSTTVQQTPQPVVSPTTRLS